MSKKNKLYYILSILFIMYMLQLFYFNSKMGTLNTKYEIIKENLIFKDLEVSYFEKQKNDIIVSSYSYLEIISKNFENIVLRKLELSPSLNQIIYKGKKNKLKETVNCGKIIFRFFSENCISCIEEELKKLEIFREKNNKIEVVLITDILTNETRDYLLSNKLFFDIYETGNLSLGIDFDKRKIPYLTICDNNLNVTLAFVLDSYSKGFSEYFYNSVMERMVQ